MGKHFDRCFELTMIKRSHYDSSMPSYKRIFYHVPKRLQKKYLRVSPSSSNRLICVLCHNFCTNWPMMESSLSLTISCDIVELGTNYRSQLRFRLVKHLKMTVWISVLWKMTIHMLQKWPEMVVEPNMSTQFYIETVYTSDAKNKWNYMVHLGSSVTA